MTKVLIIEDNEDNAELFMRVLTARGYTALHAADGETGLQMAFEHKPDLILLDLGLPDIDGQTVASQLRAAPDFATVPIVAVTAWPEETARTMVAVYGCTGYISKPVNIAKFPEQIAAYLAHA